MKAFVKLLPDAFSNKGLNFSVIAHGLTEGEGVGADLKLRPATQKSGKPQKPHWVFSKGRAHVTKPFSLQVLEAAVRVVKPALLIHSHCIYREVAATEIVFKTNGWVGMNFKAPIACACFAFGACECVFVFRVRVKKDREILSHRFKAQTKEILGSCAHHQVVPVDPLFAHQRIAHRAANTINGDAGVKTCEAGVGSVRCKPGKRVLAPVSRALVALRTQNC
jgi:hypothetical protein